MEYHLSHFIFYSTQKNIPKPANQICETVITEYFNRTNTDKGKRYRYINLMKIPLHSLEVWKRSSLEKYPKVGKSPEKHSYKYNFSISFLFKWNKNNV